MEMPGQPTAKNAQACPADFHFSPFLAYGIAAYLTTTSGSPEFWFARCGTPAATHQMYCLIFGGFSLFGFTWAVFVWHNVNAAVRFLISGAAPLLFPMLLDYLLNCT